MNQNDRDKGNPTGQMSGEAFRAYSQRELPQDSESLETFWESFYSRSVEPYLSSKGEKHRLSDLDVARLTALAGIVQGTSRQFIFRSFATFPYANECERQIVEAFIAAKGKYLNESKLDWEPESNTGRLYSFLKQLRILSEDVQYSVEFLKEKDPQHKSVAFEPESVAELLHMPSDEAKHTFYAATRKALPHLSDQAIGEIFAEATRRNEEEKKLRDFERKSAQSAEPLQYSEKPRAMSLPDFLRSEYLGKGLMRLEGFTRASIKPRDPALYQAIKDYTQGADLPDDVNIPKARNRQNKREIWQSEQRRPK